ncbi:MAG: SHD1 domain-containing protein [Planctomycetota bacterium]|nr:SHD1 domain-containing protein [Planctomycetota bacterium]
MKPVKFETKGNVSQVRCEPTTVLGFADQAPVWVFRKFGQQWKLMTFESVRATSDAPKKGDADTSTATATTDNSPSSGYRRWSIAGGDTTILAELVKVDGDTVHLKRKDNGNTIQIPLGKLSKADQKLLAGGEPTAASPTDAATSATAPSDPPTAYRKWTSAGGGFSIEAELIKVEDGIVHLKRKDSGKTMQIPLGKLSKADQKLLSGGETPSSNAPDAANTSTSPSDPPASPTTTATPGETAQPSNTAQPGEPSKIGDTKTADASLPSAPPVKIQLRKKLAKPKLGFYVCFSPDSKLLVVSDKAGFSIRDAVTGKQISQVTVPEAPKTLDNTSQLTCVEWHPSGNLIMGFLEVDNWQNNPPARKFTPFVYSVQSKKFLETIPDREDRSAYMLKPLTGNRVALVSTANAVAESKLDYYVDILDLATGQMTMQLTRTLDVFDTTPEMLYPHPVVLISDNGESTVIWDRETVYIFDKEGKPHWDFAMKSPSHGIALSPDGKSLVIGRANSGPDRGYRLYDIPQKSHQDIACDFVDWRNTLRFTPDGATIVSAGDFVSMFDVKSGKMHVTEAERPALLRPQIAKNGRLENEACGVLSPNGKVLATTDGIQAHIWDLDIAVGAPLVPEMAVDVLKDADGKEINLASLAGPAAKSKAAGSKATAKSKAAPTKSKAADPATKAASTATGYRKWTSAGGGFAIEAELVKVEGKTVHLKRKDNDKVMQIPRDKLSAEDQNLLPAE